MKFFRVKLFRTILSTAIIAMFIVSLIFSSLLVNEIKKRAQDTMQSSLTYYTDRMNEIVRESNNVFALIEDNLEVQKMLREPKSERSEWFRQRVQIDGILVQTQANNTRYMDAFYLILDDGRYFKSTYFPFWDKDFETENWYHMARSYHPSNWLDTYDSSLLANNRKHGYTAVVYPILNFRTGNREGIILMEFQTKILIEILEKGAAFEGLSVEITNEDNVIVSVGDQIDAKDSRLGWDVLSETGMLDNGWRITLSCLLWDLIGDNVKIAGSIVLISLIAISIFSIYLSKDSSREISQPIEKLLSFMDDPQNIQQGKQLTIPTDVYEINALNVAFNTMLLRINNLFLELEAKQNAVREAQFAALQAQINPHFLYNTLDNISWQIRSGNYDQALKSLMAFSRFFRNKDRVKFFAGLIAILVSGFHSVKARI